MTKYDVAGLESVEAPGASTFVADVDGANEGVRDATERIHEPARPGATMGVLIGFRDQGRTPLVVFPGQIGTAAVAARMIQDLHAAHIGLQVVLLFENADPGLPIIVGSLKGPDGEPSAGHPGAVEVEADGTRLVVSAKEQLVLRCGKASVTLTKAGKVLIQGTYLSTHSSGTNRIKGASVQIN
jgi:hypothetical protein